ncbi:M60 family peptidase N-terminal accessory domain-containing protein [Sunxiuqinia indica]|uniref:M60 family peptidase N-terminal accessory domain-containing protein n=1 Tax=Sunxiuqinia indica TaxID=2692584 RepID=UPI00135B9661|nr:M60 family peptidase N-terminal accessory domain-containing protein [Sunxiuqinia indica]
MKIKNNFLEILFIGILTGLSIMGCDVSYNYDFKDGYDDYVFDSDSVTIDTLTGIDQSMLAKAFIFPGLVGDNERRIQDTVIRLDLSYKYVSPRKLNITMVPEPIYSTGLYAGPGELIEISVPAGVMGLSVQIGSQMDDLSDINPAKREPIIYTRKALNPGTNTIRNPMGGYIWIRRPKEYGVSQQVDLQVKGACRAPDYIAGQTIPTDWKNEILNSKVPWLELRSQRIAFTVSRSWMVAKMVNNPNFANEVAAVINMWDESISLDFNYFFGLNDLDEELEYRAPEFPFRVILDAQLQNSEFIHWESQPIVAMNSEYWVDELTDLSGFRNGKSWGIYSVLGNNFDPLATPWWTSISQAATKLPLYKSVERNREDKTNMPPLFTENGIDEQFPLALSYAIADSSKMMGRDIGTSYDGFMLLPLVQLGHYSPGGIQDWSFYNYLFGEGRSELTSNQWYKPQDLLYKLLCEYYQKNFAQFFDQWGINIGDNVRVEMDNKFGFLDVALWRYDPVKETYSGGNDVDISNYRYRDARTNWTVTVYDAEGNFSDQEDQGQGIRNLIDGDMDSYWHTTWQNLSKPRQLPFTLYFDMQQENVVDGFYLADGTRKYRPRKLIIYTTDDEPYSGTIWTPLDTIFPAYDNPVNGGLKPNIRNLQFFDLANRSTFRYFKVVIPEPSFDSEVSKDGVDVMWMPGDAIDPNVYYHQTIDEFGTYHYK